MDTPAQPQAQQSDDPYADIFTNATPTTAVGIAHNAPVDDTQPSVTMSSPTTNAVEAVAPAAVGAVAGNVLGRVGSQPDYLTQAYRDANSKLTDASISHNVHSQNLDNINKLHINSIDQLQNVHNDHLQKLQQLESMTDEAFHKAKELRALPEDMAGDKWWKKSVSSSMGPGGDTTVEAARNYQIQKGATEAGVHDFVVNREGILVPNKGQNVLSPAQQVARNNFTAARDLHNSHKEITDEIGKTLDKLKTTQPSGKAEAVKKLTEAEIQKQQAIEKLKTVTDKPSFVGNAVSKLPYGQEVMDALEIANKYMNTTPVLKHVLPTVGGGFGAVQGLQGVEDWQKGEKLKGALEAMSGAGGMLGTIPHPLARGVGLGMQLPYLGYEGYQYAKDKLNK